MIYTYLLFSKPLDESVVVGFVLGAGVIQVNLYRRDTDLTLGVCLNSLHPLFTNPPFLQSYLPFSALQSFTVVSKMTPASKFFENESIKVSTS